jgi:hypothetical protein
MKRLSTIGIVAIALCGLLASAAHARPDTFVKRGHTAKVQFGPSHRTTTAAVRCPGNSALVAGYVTISDDSTPYGAEVVAEDVTGDEQGWEATVGTLGLYRAGEPEVTVKFAVAVICLR